MSMGAVFFWLCDPGKNMECRKTFCGRAGGRADGFCTATSREEYAETGPDGTKTLIYIRVTEEEEADKAGPD